LGCADGVRRETILAAATQLFAEQGFSDAVTQLLADNLGVGKGTLYRHFASKRELFLATVDRVMRRLHEYVEAATNDVPDGIERIRQGIRAYLEFFHTHPEFVEILVQERAQFSNREHPTYFEHRERNVKRWRDLYRQLIGEKRLRDLPAERISDVMSAVLYGAMFLNDYGGRSGAFAIDAEDIIDILFRGILSENERG
jgi:AcrR family transcriptional regulator